MTTKNKPTLRFYGNDINPQSFTSKELGHILIAFEDSIKSIIESKFPKAESDDVNISLVKIVDESEGLVFDTLDSVALLNDAYSYWGNAIKNETYVNLPDKAYAGYKLLLTIVKEKDCNVEFKANGNTICDIKPEHELIKPENALISGDATIYGELIKIGGEKPKAWLKLISGEDLYFSISKDDAEILKHKLYVPIGLKGEAKFNIKTKEIVRFKLYDILDYTPFQVSKAFTKLRELTGGFWDKFNTDDELTKYLQSE